MRIKRLKTSGGFSIVEILIVLAIAGLILSVIFMAVPALQRNSRNRARKNDANLLYVAVQECMSRTNNFNHCNEEAELSINIDEFVIFEGIHFGAACLNWVTSGCPQTPPTETEPNWLNFLQCHDGTALSQVQDSRQYVVGYLMEVPGSPGWAPWVEPNYVGRCLPLS